MPRAWWEEKKNQNLFREVQSTPVNKQAGWTSWGYLACTPSMPTAGK
jgi:hypothetical protein